MGKIRLDEQTTPATPPTGFAEIFVDSVDKHLKQIDDAGLIIDLTEGGGEGFKGFGLWRYRTAITSDPTAGRLQFNNTDVDIATELYVNILNDGGTDLTAFLTLLTVGDLIFIQAQDDSTQFIAVEIGGTPTDAAGVFTFPIGSVESQGAVMTNNEVVAVLGSHSGGSSGVAAEYASYYANAVTTITGVAGTIGLDVNRQQTAGFTRTGDEVTCNIDGDYAIGYDLNLDDAGGVDSTIEAWLELNSVEISGTRGRLWHDDPDEEGSTHGLIIATLVATDVIRLRAQRVAGATDLATHADGVRLSFFSIGGNGATGAQGIQGVAGSGTTLNIQDEGTPLPNSPHDAVNFIGAGVSASDAGGGVADVTIPGGPTVLQVTATAPITTTSATDVVVSGMVLTPGPGDYVVMFNSSWENNGAEDMFASIYVNGVQVAHSQRITRMESSTPDTEMAVVTHAFVTGVLAAQDIDIRFRTTGGTLTMLQRSMILLKVA
jgi:hypothetical protein